MCLDEYNRHVSKHIDGFDGINGGYVRGQGILEGRTLLECCLEKESCLPNTRSKIEEKMNATFRMGENETEIDFVLIKKYH